MAGVDVSLLKCGTDKSISDFNIIVDVFERHCHIGVRFGMLKKRGVSDVAAASLVFGFDFVIDKVKCWLNIHK